MSTAGWLGAAITPFQTTYPISAGGWFLFRSISAISGQNMFGAENSGDANHYFSVYVTNVGVISLGARAGGAGENTITAGTAGTNEWWYVVGRFITSSNRRLTTVSPAGVVTHASTTTTRSTSGLTDNFLFRNSAADAANTWGESVWVAPRDIQSDPGQLTDAVLYTLMKKGPLAFPELRYKLLAYLEFKTGVVGPRDLRGSELYANGSFSLAGTTFNGLTVGYCTPKSTGHRRLPLCGPLARPI